MRACGKRLPDAFLRDGDGIGPYRSRRPESMEMSASSASQPRATSARFAARVYAVARFSNVSGCSSRAVCSASMRAIVSAGSNMPVAITAAMQSGA